MKDFKCAMISLDLLVAIPIALAASYLLFTNFSQSSNYQVNSFSFYADRLNKYTASQELASAIDTSNINYSSAIKLVDSQSILFGFNISIIGLNANTICTEASVCRIIEIGGHSYILVVKNENSS